MEGKSSLDKILFMLIICFKFTTSPLNMGLVGSNEGRLSNIKHSFTLYSILLVFFSFIHPVS